MIGTSWIRNAALAGAAFAALQLSGCMAKPMGAQGNGCFGPCLTPGFAAAYHAPAAYYQTPGYYYGQAVPAAPAVVETHQSIPVSPYAIEPYASMAAHSGASHGSVVTTTASHSGHSAVVAGSGSMHIGQGSSYAVTSDVVALTQADCPAGTMLQSNGTCLQGGSAAYAGTYTMNTSSMGLSSGTSTMASCPAGATLQTNGTCLQGSSSVYTGTYTTNTSGTGMSSGTSMMGSCPVGTVAQSNGTCMSMTSGGYKPIPGKTGHYYRPVKK